MTNCLNIPELDKLSECERNSVLKILQEYSKTGCSETYNKLLLSDYKEQPVDIITFIKDPNYLGNAWHTSSGKCKLYPYWEEKLKILFPNPYETAYNNFIESGARGLGKSEIATTCALYLMHRLMCLKNPHEYLDLKPTEKVAFAFMNITITLAEEIGIAKFQETVKMSPWFMERGTLTGRDNVIWNPPDFINIIIGSQASHVIGQAIYCCLDEDTPIVTSEGVFPIKSLVDKQVKVFTINNNSQIELSDNCTVKATATSSVEYELELEDGTIIKCTPTHKFMLKDGTYKEAKYLTCDDELFDVKKYGYIYKTTNKVNNKIYIGQKHCSTFLSEEYLGSGTLLKKAINKYGKEQFYVELLCWCDSKESLDELEKFYISKFNSINPSIGYNISEGGQGGNLGPAINSKISAALVGHSISADTKTKISNSLKGHVETQEQRKKISIGNKGKILSASTKAKMSASAKALDRTGRKTSKNKIAINDGKITKFIDNNIDIPHGWVKGNLNTRGTHNMSNYYLNSNQQKLNSLSKSGEHNSMYGKGYKIAGGNNGKATIDYWYNNQYFDCRKSLVLYLQSIDSTISVNLIRNIEHGTYKQRTIRKYKWLIDNLRWKRKHED